MFFSNLQTRTVNMDRRFQTLNGDNLDVEKR